MGSQKYKPMSAPSAIAIDGELEKGNFTASYRSGDRTLAVATVSRDLQSLIEEAAMETR